MHASQRRQVQVGEVVTVSRLATKPNLDNMPFALRALADRIDAGKEPGLDRVVVILNGEDLAFEHYGKPCSLAELVGLMEFTKSLLLYPEE